MSNLNNIDVLRTMSYNIWGSSDIYNRADNQAAVIMRYLPDSVGIQECSKPTREKENGLLELLKREYTEVPVLATNEKRNNYTALLYRPKKLRLIDHGWHYYVGLNDAGSKTITWAVFECNGNGQRFIHMNTHFYWKSTDDGRACRVSNAGEMLHLMYHLLEKYPVPIIFTGDFNCNTSEPPIEVLRGFGLKEVRYTAKESSPWRSHHAYPAFDEKNRKFCNGVHPTKERDLSIDHIFTYGDITAEKFVTVVDDEALESSDHCPIYADFTF